MELNIPHVGFPVVWHPGANPAASCPALVAGRSDLGLLTLVVFEPSRVRQIIGVPALDRVDDLRLSREDRARLGAWSFVPGLVPQREKRERDGK